MWLDNISIVSRPDLVLARKPDKSLAVENTTEFILVVVLPSLEIFLRLDTIEEMNTYLHDNVIDASMTANTPIVEHLASKDDINLSSTHQENLASADKLFFISYRGSNPLHPVSTLYNFA